MSRRAAVTAVVVSVTALLAGCTGVPTGSLPQTVESIGGGQPQVIAGGPRDGESPNQIVEGFLSANTSDPVKHSTAREYLTTAARNRWSDTTVTIISNKTVGIYDSAKHTVTFTGSKVGMLDRHGVYTPTLDGIGHGGARVPFTFGIETVGTRNLISSLSPGLLLTEQQFQVAYQQRSLYFFDSTEHYLVPDPRYSPVTDANQTSDWVLNQLIQGPNQNLAGAVNNDPLAAQSQPISVKITAASTTVQVPGARQLGADVRDRLAAQISTTLFHAVGVHDMSLVDGDRKVPIPRVNGTRFSVADFTTEQGPRRPAGELYYLREGRIRTQTGKALPGPLGSGSVRFDSVGISRPSSIGALTVAGVQGPKAGLQHLVIAGQNGVVHATPLPPGRLTRPAWFPGRAEVWIGDGAKLYRVRTDGRTSQVAPIQIPSVAGGGRLVAVRPSPDGSRVALVVEGVNNQPQLYVAAVVRTGSTVQVEAATLISPVGTVVDDVAWVDPLKLYGIGYLAQGKDSQVYRMNVDGSAWTNDGIGSLPNPPDSITMTFDGPPWVSTEGAEAFVWSLNGGTWVSPVATNGQTPGDSPIYVD